MPFHYLDHDGWSLSLYGNYDRPISDFSYRCQPDLKKALVEHGLGELEFDFGYQFRTANHIILARRAEGRAITQARFDSNNGLGEGTTCQGDVVRVQISRRY